MFYLKVIGNITTGFRKDEILALLSRLNNSAQFCRYILIMRFVLIQMKKIG